MRCSQARPLFSSYLDGAVSGREMRQLALHFDQCPACRSQYSRLEFTRIAVASLGHKQAPPDLAMRIRVSLSSARSQTWRELLHGRMAGWQYAFDSFMLPATAGIMAAIFFFAALIGFFPAKVKADDTTDVPTMLYTPPRLESSVYTDSDLNLDSSLLIETDVDATGRVQDYRIISGRDDEQVREQLNRALLFTIFAPAQSFGRPVPGKVVISFSHIHVKG
jgi:hypothetical protein